MRLLPHPDAPDHAEGTTCLIAHAEQGQMRQLILQPSLPFENAMGDDWSKGRAVIDMSDIQYIDSAAIGWLICAYNAFDQDGGRLVLCNLQTAVRRVLAVMRLDEVLLIGEDLPAAINIAET